VSAILSFRSASSVCILTDGAAYDHEGRLTRILEKIDRSSKAPIAVATRGNSREGWVASQFIIRLLEQEGFDKGIAALADALPEFGLLPDSSNRLEVLIAGVSERDGPRHLTFNNLDPLLFGTAMRIEDPGEFFSGINGDGGDRDGGLAASGVRGRVFGESTEAWLAAMGGKIFDFYRRISIPPAPWNGDRRESYLIGGHVDLTVVDRGGVRTRRIHHWPEDKIGERINPYAGENVTPIAAGSRRGRRADKRKAAAQLASTAPLASSTSSSDLLLDRQHAHR
jgi:hypothetical protein